MIKKIVIKPYTLYFRHSFKIAYEEVDQTSIVIIKLVDQNGFIGLGSAAPAKEYTGESLSQVLKILQKYLKQDFFNFSLDEWYFYHEKIQKIFQGFPSAQAAVEEAVLNLFCRQKSLSLFNLFGGYRKSAEIMVTVGIQDLKFTQREVENRLKEGFSVIKLKGGINLKKDVEKIKAIIRILPPKAKLTLDANQGYSFTEAEQLLRIFKKSRISLIEQPIDSRNLNGLKKLCALKLIPIVADEAVVTIQDAFKIMSGNYADGVNIKLMKCGGPLNFLKIFHLAKSLNKIIMIGCVYESNISITTGAHLALALPIDFVDLDSGHMDFSDDPVKGGAKVIKGKILIGKKLFLK